MMRKSSRVSIVCQSQSQLQYLFWITKKDYKQEPNKQQNSPKLRGSKQWSSSSKETLKGDEIFANHEGDKISNLAILAKSVGCFVDRSPNEEKRTIRKRRRDSFGVRNPATRLPCIISLLIKGFKTLAFSPSKTTWFRPKIETRRAYSFIARTSVISGEDTFTLKALLTMISPSELSTMTNKCTKNCGNIIFSK